MTTRQMGRKGGLKRGPTKARHATAAEAARKRGVMARRIRELEEALRDLWESSGWAVAEHPEWFDRAWKHAKEVLGAKVGWEEVLKAKEVGQ